MAGDIRSAAEEVPASVTDMAPSWTLLLLLLPALAASHQHQTHKICVPRTAIEACKKMTGEGKAAGVSMECVEARDRLDCLYKVERHEADFEPVEPEDMYIAGSNIRDSAFAVFKEIRTKEEPNGEHRYEAVSVIHKDLDIKSVSQLKGLKSCHTGVGRNVGYKIPITKLTGMGVLGPLSDASLSPRENELKALSQFFSKACLVGTWSPHPETNQRLKKTYSNLCELCEDPEKCDYPDQNSGYEGALRCLATAGGQVAWTKVIYVKKFFGMAYGSQPAKQSQFNPDDFAYFCPDGSKRPISGGQPCTWAARPWPAFISSTHLQTDEMKQLRDEIAKLNALGESSHADWLAKVLTITNLTLSVDNGPFSPLQYLEKAKYKDVIERDVLKPRRQVRLCTKTQLEMEKCKLLGLSAYSRDIRPSLACVQSDDCLAAVHRKEAELVILDPHQAIAAQAHRLKPILYETYETNATAQEMVAVVPSSSPANAMADLRGRKACLPPNDSAGFFGVLKFLLKTGLIGKNHCPYEKTLTEFFSSVTTSADPLKCLKEGQGEVAFLPLSALYLDGKDLETLCPEGGRSKDWKKCSLTSVPPRLVMTCSELSEVQTDEAMQTLLSAANLYSKNPSLFQLFGRFNSTPNVLFSDHGRGLKAIQDVLPSYEEYKKLVSDLSSCQG